MLPGDKDEGRASPLWLFLNLLLLAHACKCKVTLKLQTVGSPENSSDDYLGTGPTLVPPYGKQDLFTQLPYNLTTLVPLRIIWKLWLLSCPK
jgi:hypothetical protein